MITNNSLLTVFDFHYLRNLDAAAPLPSPEQQEVNSTTELALDPFLASQHTGIAVETPVPMLNTAPVERSRGRPPGSSSEKSFVNTSSTQRDHSHFEYVKNANRPGPSRRHCGICEYIGHNVRTCPQRILFSPEDNPTPAAPE
ncbi:hypothetical protein GcC1_072022 [Golovinomyces cichoracearum]|uniref:Uncharacterized protein n=1 Tax=Golovinomyces cichoracearum TaxID=62708 RepID=A0A420IP54_9PEZI|nr:hypothetical protein GcC1_072022 [Golovinomyces cichoracearum]